MQLEAGEDDSVDRGNTNTFYTLVDGDPGNIGVVRGGNGKYLRTYSDGNGNDSLLSLPER
jgi:hypothetical protein